MDCTVQDYFSILQSQTKLRTYVKYKHDFKLEPYVTKLNFKNRQELSRLRLSDHKLKVEVGQYTKPKTPLEDRTRTFCPNSVEDEYHFSITWPMYEEEREKLKRGLESNQTTKRQTIHDKLFDLLFSCNENHSGKISKFINSITKIREEKLNFVEIFSHYSFLAFQSLELLLLPFFFFSPFRACSHEPGTVSDPGVMIAPGQALPRIHMMICCPGAMLSWVNFIALGQVQRHLITTNLSEFL